MRYGLAAQDVGSYAHDELATSSTVRVARSLVPLLPFYRFARAVGLRPVVPPCVRLRAPLRRDGCRRRHADRFLGGCLRRPVVRYRRFARGRFAYRRRSARMPKDRKRPRYSLGNLATTRRTPAYPGQVRMARGEL